MHTWMWLVLLALGLIKLPIAALMLWIPFRSDAALESLAPAPGESADGEDGGSKTLPGGVSGGGRGPRVGGPHPRSPLHGRRPRRGPHGGAACPSPGRARATCRSAKSVAHR
jgi:hypothetical protein